MSIAAIRWAVTAKTRNATGKAILLLLADAHNGKTGRCDPSHARLIKTSRSSPGIVKRTIRELEDDGFISRHPKTDSRGGTTGVRYALHFGGGATGDHGGRPPLASGESAGDLEVRPALAGGESTDGHTIRKNRNSNQNLNRKAGASDARRQAADGAAEATTANLKRREAADRESFEGPQIDETERLAGAARIREGIRRAFNSNG